MALKFLCNTVNKLGIEINFLEEKKNLSVAVSAGQNLC